jgi:hypothetical protein
MLTNYHLRLRPSWHLTPFVESLNEHVLRFTSDRVEKDEAFMSSLPTKGGHAARRQHRMAAELAVEYFRGSLFLRNARFLGRHAPGRFLQHMAAEGIADARASFDGWRNVWRFLLGQHPELAGRIGRCRFCARFFYRYHRNDTLCSPVCRIGPGLVKRLPAAWKAEMRRRVRAGVQRIREFESSHNRSIGEYARRRSTPFFGPVLGVRMKRLDSLRGIANRLAFLSAWRFVFVDEHRTRNVRDRIALCTVCGELFYRYRMNQQPAAGEHAS